MKLKSSEKCTRRIIFQQAQNNASSHENLTVVDIARHFQGRRPFFEAWRVRGWLTDTFLCTRDVDSHYHGYLVELVLNVSQDAKFTWSQQYHSLCVLRFLFFFTLEYTWSRHDTQIRHSNPATGGFQNSSFLLLLLLSSQILIPSQNFCSQYSRSDNQTSQSSHMYCCLL